MIDFKKIEKSLVNRDVPVLTYNPQIIVNKHVKNIKHKIIENLNQSDSVDIAVSYVVMSGLQLLITSLEKFNTDSRLITTIDGYVTDPTSLSKLLDLNIKTKVYAPKESDKGFHLKSYAFKSNNNVKLMIGSANISSRAFAKAHEMMVEIDANESGHIIKEYSDAFNDLWEDQASIDLTIEFISQYEIEYKKYHTPQQVITDLNQISQNIIPNYMQMHALEHIEQSRSEKKGLVIAATGTGKTYLSAFDVRNFGAKKVLFLAHNRLILTSAKKTYDTIFGNNQTIELNATNIDQIDAYAYIFTTDKTACDHIMNKVPSTYFDYIVYDEAHKIGEDTKYSKIFDYFKPDYALGITATPERTKHPEYLFKTFNYIIPYEIRLLDALNHELICPFTYFGYNTPEDILDSNERFLIPELSRYMQKLISQKGHYGKKTKGIVFCRDQKEAYELSESLNNIGFHAISVTSQKESLNREETEKAILSLASDDDGSLQFICVVNRFNEGIDIPEINVIFMLRNTESSIIYLQQLGRGLRKTFDPNKFVTVYDLIGNSKNNYSIAQVLTGNSTVDKREIYVHIRNQFNDVSPFLNVEIEKEAVDHILKSISNHFKVKTELKNKFMNAFYRYKSIPDLVDMFKMSEFKEIDLLQLLFNEFYTPFESYYAEKYDIKRNSLFLRNFFTMLNQFVFRGYNKTQLKDYIDVLEGKEVKNSVLSRILLFSHVSDGIATSVYSNYYKAGNNFTDIFIQNLDFIKLNEHIIDDLKKEHAYELFLEHIALYKVILERDVYELKPFDLLDKAEFLLLNDSKNCYMNAVGEMIDHHQKKVFCPITISKERKNYANSIEDDQTLVYCTQKTPSIERSRNKDYKITNGQYQFHICAKFPHLGYENTTYFNLDKLTYLDISETLKHPDGGYYHQIKFKLDHKIPPEMLQYKKMDLS